MAESGNTCAQPFDMAYRGYTSNIKALIAKDESLKTKTDTNCRMLLHWAALGGHEDLVNYLLSLDVPVDAGDDMSMTPLILAASAGREKIVKTLINEGANINAKSKTGHSALQYAASKNWVKICAFLIEKEADINIADETGATPLHRAASKGNMEVVKMLLTRDDLLIDLQDRYGDTALHLVCEEEQEDIAKLLVTNKASLTIENKKKKTPLDMCKSSLSKQLLEIEKNIDTLYD